MHQVQSALISTNDIEADQAERRKNKVLFIRLFFHFLAFVRNRMFFSKSKFRLLQEPL